MVKSLRFWLSLVVLTTTMITAKAQLGVTVTGTNPGPQSGTDITPFGTLYEDGRDQYLYTGAELSALGIAAGTLDSLGFFVTSVGSPDLSNLTIKVKNTTATSVSGLDTAGMVVVYSAGTPYAPSLGLNNFKLQTPFVYTGGSLLIEVCFDNTAWSGNSGIIAHTTTDPMTYYLFDDGVVGCDMTSAPFGQGTLSTRPDLRIVVLPASGRDAAINALISPNNLSIGANQVSVRIASLAADPIATVDLTYQLDNNTPVTVTGVSPTTPLNPGQTFDYTFSTPINIAAQGNYTLKVWLTNANGLGADNNVSNDTITRNICTGLTGAYTIGATGTYPSIQAAVNDLNNCGISGPVSFSIEPGTYYGSYSIANVIGGGVHQISFTSSTSNPADVILIHDTATAATNRNVFQVNNTPNVTFSLMTFRRTLNPSGTFYMVGYLNNSNFGSVISCVFDDQTTLSSVPSGSRAVSADNSDNLNIASNTFTGFYYAVYLTGPTSNNGYESSNQVTGNTFTNYRYAIYLINQSLFNVIGNNISNAATTFGYGVYLSRGTGFTIADNRISGTIAGGGIYIFNPNDSIGLDNLVYNNAVSGITYTATSSFTSWYGIYVSGFYDATATAPINPQDNIQLYHNTVNFGVRPVSGSTSFNTALHITGGSNATPAWTGIVLNNNMVVGYQPAGANPSATLVALYLPNDSTARLTNSNYNNFYLYDEATMTTLSNPVVSVGGTPYNTLADWSAFANQDTNSVSIRPNFGSANLAIPTAFLVNDLGTPISFVPTDINGNVRSATTPDIGAYEFTPSPFDLTATSILSYSLCADSNQVIEVVVRNVGFETYDFATNNATLSLTINGPIPQTYSLVIATDSLQVDSSRTYLVSSVVDFSTPGNYTLDADISSTVDGNALNNATSRTLNFVTPLPVPYSQNFNALTAIPAGFLTSFNFNLTNGVDQTPGLRRNVWSTTVGDLRLPLIGPIPGPGYVFEFAYKIIDWPGSWPGIATALGSGDSIKILVSEDCGLTYQMVSVITDQNHTTSNEFAYYPVPMTAYAGKQVYIKLEFTQQSGIDVDFDVDNFRIYLPPPVDLSVNRILTPNDGCGLGNDTVSVRLINIGTAAQTAVPLSYTINGGAPVTEVFAGPINPGDTAIYTFTTTANLTAPGAYQFRAYHGQAGDGDFSNDTTNKTVNNIPIISTFPYVEGWENGSGGWVSGGTSSSWAVGAPNDVTNTPGLVGAYNGNNAWVTNLTGNYNNAEASWVVSPCIDLTSLSNVRIRFGLWYSSEASWDGGNFAYSTDGGSSWQVAGSVGSAINWYNAASVSSSQGQPVWAGNGGGAWLPAEITLPQLAGQANVRFRFQFYSDGSFNAYSGMAIDSFVVEMPTDPIIDSVTVATDSCINATRSITADIIQFRSLTNVNLHYDITASGTYTAIPMTRVGTSSNWTATIPLSSAAVRNRYFVSVVDSIGLTDTSNVYGYIDNYLSVSAFPAVRNVQIGDTVILRATAVGIANVKITEVVQFRGGTGATPTYPAYATGADLIEISNLGNGQADLSGYGFEVYGTGARTYTFPAGAIVPGNGVLILHIGSGTDDPTNAYYNTGGANDAIFSTAPTGYLLTNAVGAEIDAVATNGYSFPAGSVAQWTGSIPGSSAGVSRINSDNNDAADWVISSSASPMTVGTLNPGMTLSTPAGGISWNTTPVSNSDTLVVGPFTSTGTFTYVATVTDGRCTASDTVIITVGTSAPDVGVSRFVTPVAGARIDGNSPTQVTVIIKNYGSVPATGFDVEYRVDTSLSIVTNSITQTIAPGDSIQHIFSVAWTPTSGGPMTLSANTTGAANEVNRANDTAFVTVNSTINVEELALNNRLIGNVYPNPAANYVNFEFNEFTGQGTLEILDQLGRVVAVEQVNRENGRLHTIRTESWSAGMYNYRFIARDQVQHGTVIIRH